MNFSFIDPNHLKTFMLIMTRIGSFVMTLPFFGSAGTTIPVRVGISLFISMVIFPMVPTVDMPDTFASYLIGIGSELLIGILIGFACLMFFGITQLAGFLAGMQIGLRMSQLMNPFDDSEASIIGQFYFFLMTLLLFAANGHLFLLRGMFDSFRFIPLMGMSMNGDICRKMIEIFVYVFNTGVQLSAPVLFVGMIIHIGKGLLSKTAPEINILMIGFPIVIILGLQMLKSTLPMSAMLIRTVFNRMFNDMYVLLRLM